MRTRDRLFAHAGHCPPPQLALSDSDPSPLGVIGFARFPRPSDREEALWIDVLYIAPTLRRRGIGTLLIERALTLASAYGSELYVYTDCPPLYQRAGFQEVSRDEKDFSVLRIAVGTNST